MNVTNEGEIKEIRALARKRGIEGYKRMRKTELRDVLAQPQRLLFVLSRLIQTFLFLNYGEALLLKTVMERSALGLSVPLFSLSQDLPFTSFAKLSIDLEEKMGTKSNFKDEQTHRLYFVLCTSVILSRNL